METDGQVAAYLQQSRLGSDGHDLASSRTHSQLSDVGNEREMPASFGRKELGPRFSWRISTSKKKNVIIPGAKIS